MRVIDQLTLRTQGPDAPRQLPETGLPITATYVLILKPGDARGTFGLRIEIEAPDTTRIGGGEQAVTFSGGPTSGVNVIVPIQWLVTMTGLYWANVYLDGRPLARTPLNITYEWA